QRSHADSLCLSIQPSELHMIYRRAPAVALFAVLFEECATCFEECEERAECELVYGGAMPTWSACSRAYWPPACSSFSCVPTSTILPSLRTRIRSARLMVPKRWAITKVVRPRIKR